MRPITDTLRALGRDVLNVSEFLSGNRNAKTGKYGAYLGARDERELEERERRWKESRHLR